MNDVTSPVSLLDGETMLCPNCAEINVHFASLPPTMATEEFTSPHRFVRGAWLALYCYCETCPHRWTLLIGEHKGTVRITQAPRP